MTDYRVQLAFAIADDETLSPRPLVGSLIDGESRRAGGVTWTRGSADHVVVLTSTWPSSALDALAAHFATSVFAIDERLASAGACLLPVMDGTSLVLSLEIDGRRWVELGNVQETIAANLALCAQAAEASDSTERLVAWPDDYSAALAVIRDRGSLADRIATPMRRAREATYRRLAHCLRNGTPFL